MRIINILLLLLTLLLPLHTVASERTDKKMNIFENIPSALNQEVFEDLLKHKDIRIERIISKGQTTPQGQWYDQEDNEWVIVLQGGGDLTYADGTVLSLKTGDYVNIPAHTKHRVSWTDPEQETIWLAIFYK